MKPCAIPNCPALRVPGSYWCAVHRAMTHFQRALARQEAREAMTRRLELRPVTTRIGYE